MRIGESICIDEKVGTMYLYPIISKDFEECARKQESRKVVFLTHFLICLPWLVFLKLEAKYIIRIVWILLDIQSNWKNV